MFSREIDVVHVSVKVKSEKSIKEEAKEIPEEPSNSESADSQPKPKQKRACLMLPEDDPGVFSFVANAARQIGVSGIDRQEEIAPKIFYPAAQKLIVRATKTMCESLIRKSHRAAYRRVGGPPAEVTMADILAAVEEDPGELINLFNSVY